jgi:hypothetical protein
VDVSKITYLVAYLAPGFLFVKIFGWTARQRRITDLQLNIWSIVVSALLLVGVRYSLDSWRHQPALTTIFKDPSKAFIGLWLVVIASGCFLGYSLGRLDRWKWLGEQLKKLGINLGNSLDLWQVALDEYEYAQIWLRDGTRLYGFVAGFSTNRAEPTEIQLALVERWNESEKKFNPLCHEGKVLIDVTNVLYLELMPKQQSEQPKVQHDQDEAKPAALPDVAAAGEAPMGGAVLDIVQTEPALVRPRGSKTRRNLNQ